MANYPDSLPSATPATHADVNDEVIAIAAELDAHKAAGGGGGGDFTTQTYVPVLSQSGVRTMTVLSARFFQVGDWVIGNVALLTTAPGSGGQAFTVTVPLPAVDPGSDPLAVGAGWMNYTLIGEDSQYQYTVALISGIPGVVAGTPQFVFYRGSEVHESPDTAALLSGKVLTFNFAYEVA